MVLFLLPFGAYFDADRLSIYTGIVFITFIVALMVPPVGWMRPHPYSDFEGNRGSSGKTD